MPILTSPFPPVPALQPRNVHEFLFRRPGQELPKYTLHIDAVTGRKRSSHEFLERVYDGATALSASVSDGGVELKPNEIVGILGDNCLDYVTLIHSLLVITIPFALLSSYSTPYELTHALRLSRTTRLFVAPRLLSLALQCAQEVGLPQDRIYILEGRGNERASFDGMVRSIKSRTVPRASVRPASKDTLAYLVFSSGTTGRPKAVMISHGNICFVLMQNVIVMQETTKVYTPPAPRAPGGLHINMAFLPFYHTFGLHMFVFRAFLAPSTTVIMPKWNAEVAVDMIPRYRITRLSIVPSVVQPFLDVVKSRTVDLSSLQFIGSGAAYLSPQLAEQLSRSGPNLESLGSGFGMSECTINATVQPHPNLFGGKIKPVPGNVGVLFPGMEAKIVKDDGSLADFNEPGELYLKGENIALGYWNNEAATKETFLDGGWLRTGDRFRANEDGLFFFEDRVKDTLKVSGMQVSPTEIEDVLLAQPDGLVNDVSVAGVSGGRTSDEKIPRAWVVLTKAGRELGEKAVIERLISWSRRNLSKYKWLRGGIEVVDQIPKSPTGKVLRRELQQRYEERKTKARL